jgi:hypothetical protein
MVKRAALGLVLLPTLILAGAKAFGEDLGWAVGGDGNQLITACKSAVQRLDEPSREFTKQEVYNIGYCHGIVSGVADTTQEAGLIDIRRGQMVRVVQKYLVDHPENLSLAASFSYTRGSRKSLSEGAEKMRWLPGVTSPV